MKFVEIVLFIPKGNSRRFPKLLVVSYRGRRCTSIYIVTNKDTGQKEGVYEIFETGYKGSVTRFHSPEILKQGLIKNYAITLSHAKDELKVYPTGIDRLDSILDGGLKHGLYVFGANPGLGKTSLMLHILINLAQNGYHCLLFNLEMSLFQVTTKLLSNFSYRKSLEDINYNPTTINQFGLPSKDKETGKLDSNIQQACKDYSEVIDPFITIATHSEKNDCRYVEAVGIALKNYKECHNIAPVVVIDFLQLLQVREKYDEKCNHTNSYFKHDKRMEMNAVIEQLKTYSNTYKVPIILISSLSRGAYTKENIEDDVEYSLSVFKETGHIEYTADFLALLTKGETKVNFGEANSTIININILKNRYGETGGRLPLEFIQAYSYFKQKKER